MIGIKTFTPLTSRTSFILLALLYILMCLDSNATAQVLKWEIEGTVVEIEDPEMVFTEVRLGDPVRGFLSYDLSALASVEDPDNIFYEHDPTFEVAGMVIENPRDGSEIKFLPDNELPSLVSVINDGVDEITGVSDSVLALQGVISRGGLPELFPSAVLVGLIGPPDVLEGASLPLELHLDDWPEAIISYADFIGGTFIFAEIHTLVLVPEPSTIMLAMGAVAPLVIRRRRLR